VEMFSVGANRISMSLLIKQEEVERTVRSLHQEFFGAKAAPHSVPGTQTRPATRPQEDRDDARFASGQAMAWHMISPLSNARTL
jgi:hypothetical protein